MGHFHRFSGIYNIICDVVDVYLEAMALFVYVRIKGSHYAIVKPYLPNYSAKLCCFLHKILCHSERMFNCRMYATTKSGRCFHADIHKVQKKCTVNIEGGIKYVYVCIYVFLIVVMQSVRKYLCCCKSS